MQKRMHTSLLIKYLLTVFLKDTHCDTEPWQSEAITKLQIDVILSYLQPFGNKYNNNCFFICTGNIALGHCTNLINSVVT